MQRDIMTCSRPHFSFTKRSSEQLGGGVGGGVEGRIVRAGLRRMCRFEHVRGQSGGVSSPVGEAGAREQLSLSSIWSGLDVELVSSSGAPRVC